MSKEINTLQIDGIDYTTSFTKKWLNRKRWERPNANIILPQIPGTIMRIDVKVGDKVEEGDLLLILQAMKMNNKIVAPVSGTIKEICVKEGDKVTKGQVMIIIE